MTSSATRRFWKLYHELPEPIQRLAVKNYRLWQQNPNHPSLDFKKLGGAMSGSPCVSAFTTAHWDISYRAAWNGSGLAHTKLTTSWSGEKEKRAANAQMRWAFSASGNLLRRAIHAPAQGSQSRYLDASCSSRNSIYSTPRLKFQRELFTSKPRRKKRKTVVLISIHNRNLNQPGKGV